MRDCLETMTGKESLGVSRVIEHSEKHGPLVKVFVFHERVYNGLIFSNHLVAEIAMGSH